MNISKFIAKFVLAFFVFSSISVQGPVFAGGVKPDASVEKNDQPDQYAQENPLVRELRARELRKRSKLKNMFLWGAYLALSAGAFYGCHTLPDGHPNRLEVAALGVCCGVIGTFGMYDFLKARFWGR